MNTYLQNNPWCIIEEGFNTENQLKTETDFCLGNGNIYQQANFEEYYSGETIRGSYISGMTTNNLVTCGQWKNEYNDSIDKIINAPDWTAIIVRLNDEVLDLKIWEVVNFRWVLNMHEGTLERTFEAVSPKGNHIEIKIIRLLSLAETEIGAIKYSVKSLNFEGRISFMPLIDGDLKNQQTDINELTWNVLQTKVQQDVAHIWIQLRRMDFHVCGALSYVFKKNNEQLQIIPTKIEKEKVVGYSIGTDVKVGDTLTLQKFTVMICSANFPRQTLTESACTLARAAKEKGWEQLFEEHKAVLDSKWKESDRSFENDIPALKETRYQIFKSLMSIA